MSTDHVASKTKCAIFSTLAVPFKLHCFSLLAFFKYLADWKPMGLSTQLFPYPLFALDVISSFIFPFKMHSLAFTALIIYEVILNSPICQFFWCSLCILMSRRNPIFLLYDKWIRITSLKLGLLWPAIVYTYDPSKKIRHSRSAS